VNRFSPGRVPVVKDPAPARARADRDLL